MVVDPKVISIVKAFKKDASKMIKVDAVYLFGSSARRERQEYSDIDVAVVSPDFTGFSFMDRKKLGPIVLKHDLSIELHPFRRKDFTRSNPFVWEIIKTGIKVK
jgi:predicted nucleotidyltransferase